MPEDFTDSQISLIIGCPRSGTTLIRLILETHPQIAVYEEVDTLHFLPNKDFLQKEIFQKKKEGKKKFVFKAPAITEQLNNADSMIEGLNRKHYPYYFKYENQLLIFLVRDPRDVCLSLKKLKSKSNGNDWIDIWYKYIDELYPATILNFKKKYSKELQIINDSKKNSFYAKAALYWKIKTEAFFKYDELGYKQILILYEDLVKFPKRNLEQICEFLNIPFNDNMLKHHEFDHIRTGPRGFTVGRTDAKRPIDPNATKLYLNEMTEEEQNIILSIAGETYKEIQKKYPKNNTIS